MKDRELLKQALEFAEDIVRGKYKGNAEEVRDALRAALWSAVGATLEQQEQEPVAFKCWHPVARGFYLSTEPPESTRPDTGEPDEYFGGKVEPLYTHPPRKWKGLTDEWIDAIWPSPEGTNSIRAVAYAVEQALKEKNK